MILMIVGPSSSKQSFKGKKELSQVHIVCFEKRQLWSVRRLLTKDAAKTLVHASIVSRIDYCNSVLNRACAVHLRPLQSVLHSAARLILRIRKYDRISAAIREELHWLPVHHRIRFKTCGLGAQMPTWTRTFILNRRDRVGLQGTWAASSMFCSTRRSSCSSISNKNT